MGFTNEELRSQKQELESFLRVKRVELADIKKEIGNLFVKKTGLERKNVEAAQNVKALNEKIDAANKQMHSAKIEARNIILEANSKRAEADAEKDRARLILGQRTKELAALDADRGVIEDARNQRRENIATEKILRDKISEYEESKKILVVEIKAAEEINATKKEFDEKILSLDESINIYKTKREALDENYNKLAADQLSLADDIGRESVKLENIADMENDLKVRHIEYDKKFRLLEEDRQFDKEKMATTIENINIKSRAVEQKEKKLQIVVDRIKKSKKFEDDLKAIGL